MRDKETNAKCYGRGIPTLIDVERLRKRFGVPDIDSIIKYTELEEELGITKESFRFISVMAAWRKKLERESNVILRAITGQGLQACSASSRVDMATRKYRSGVKRIIRAGDIAAKTDRSKLDENEKKLCEFLQISGAKISTAIACMTKKLPSMDDVLGLQQGPWNHQREK